MFEKQLKDTLKPLYKEMLNDISQKVTVTFCTQWGEDYPIEKNKGILFVGKATNGWISKSESKDVDVLFEKDGIFAKSDQMVWVKKKHGKYNPKRSAFWRVINKISSPSYGKDWLENTAWSNTYKVSNKKGNPSSKLRAEQEKYCIKILEKEIEILSPKYVVFLTSDWERFFINHLKKSEDFKFINKEEWGKRRGKRSHEKYYSQSYSLNDTIYITSFHPQGKSEKSHAKAIRTLMT